MRRHVASVTIHVFEVPAPGEAAKRGVEIQPLLFIAREGDDFRLAAGALRQVARELETTASPIVRPPDLLGN
jgi:hypothetical protein